MKNKIFYKKLDEDDILEILLEYFQNDELSDCSNACGCLKGKVGENLRFVGAFSNDEDLLKKQDLDKIDKEIVFNGDHSFLKNNPEFYLNKKSF